MGVARAGRCRWDLLPAALLALAALALAGCTSSPGGGAAAGTADGTPSTTDRFMSLLRGPNKLPAAPPSPDSPGWVPSMDSDCPSVEVRTGASTLTVTNKSQQQPTASDVRYQLTIGQLARQCMLVGRTMRMKVGAQGRVIVGPAGAPAQIDVPIRYAVVQEGVEPKTITTKFRRAAVTMAAGETNVTFSDVEEDLSFSLPSYADLDAYVVYVGFDDVGDRNERRPAPKKAAPRPK
jgi:hypothetical protein